MKEFITSLPGIISVVGIICLLLLRYLPKTNKTFILKRNVQQIMQVIISAIILTAGLYIILSKEDPYPTDTVNWAFGAIGLIIGFWLPSG